MARSKGGTPRARAISRAAALRASRKSMSFGESDIDFQSRPPSSRSGRPALSAPWKPCSSSRFRRSYCSVVRLPSRAV
jgi:hypothetical protein